MTELDRTGRTVIGLFRDRRHAEEAIRDLQASGFPDDRIGLAMQDASEARSVEDTVSGGLSEDAARHFDHGLRAGGALVTVDAGPRTGEALAIMQRHEVDLGPAGDAGYNLGSRYVLDSSTPGAMTERRRVADPSYSGPERRLIGV